MTWKHVLFFVGYILFFAASVAAMLWWHKRQRKARLPFGDELRLVRAPGETQLKMTLKFDEDLILWLMIGAGVPVGIFGVMLAVVGLLPSLLQLAWLVASVLAFLGAFIAAARWLSKKTQENSNRYLGYFGERIVAEHLEPLKLLGWRIFHDVPCQNNGSNFNIDHIAVGPQGVYAVETKTRRKGGARPGYDDHKVFFDGSRLVWPWGEDNHGLEQAERSALWLAENLKAETGERVFVTPILTLPGWWVENKPARESRLCRVTNPKGLPKFLTSGSPILDPKQINDIAAKLDARCRDVEY